MNKFKRDMDKYIGADSRFSEPLKEKILLRITDDNRTKKHARKGFSTLKVSVIFIILLAFVGSFLAFALTENGREIQPASSNQAVVPIKNFSDRSENWKVTYTQKDLGDGVRSAFMTVEFIGEGQPPDEVNYDFTYRKDLASFGGSLILYEEVNYAEADFGTCTACILYTDQDEIPGEIEWDGQSENLVLTKSSGSKWKESPLFKINDYTLLGEEGRAGFIYDDLNRFYVNSPQKYMWHFWGSKVDLTGTFKVVGTHENSNEEITVVPEEKSIPSPNNGADHHIPTIMELPEKGIWQLKAVINGKVIGTVYVEVHEK